MLRDWKVYIQVQRDGSMPNSKAQEVAALPWTPALCQLVSVYMYGISCLVRHAPPFWMELRMCCRVEDPHLPYCSILCHARMAHPTASSPFHPQTTTGAFSTNFKGRGGLHGDSRTHGGQLHRPEHMAEQRQAFDVSSVGPTSLHQLPWPLQLPQQDGSCPAGGSGSSS